MMIFENIKLALSGLLANKMRALLTMLGIIIGIGSVIAIMTVSTSLTNSITDTFADMGANNITVGLKQKSEEQEVRSNGMKFGKANRQFDISEGDRLSDEMITSLQEKFSEIKDISYEETVGSGTVKSGANSANINVSGINTGYYEANDMTLLAGRNISEADVKGNKSVIVVSDKVVEYAFDGDSSAALNQKINVDVNGVYYTFYIVGIYEYEDNGVFSSDSDEEITTSAYIPITT